MIGVQGSYVIGGGGGMLWLRRGGGFVFGVVLAAENLRG